MANLLRGYDFSRRNGPLAGLSKLPFDFFRDHQGLLDACADSRATQVIAG